MTTAQPRNPATSQPVSGGCAAETNPTGDTPEGALGNRRCRPGRLEASDRFLFVLVNFEHGDELRDVQQLVQLCRQVEQLQLPAAIGDRRVRADELTDARRI